MIDCVRAWKEQGSQVWLEERVLIVIVNNAKLLAVYQLFLLNKTEVDDFKKTVEIATASRGRDEVIITGGDWNAHLGRGNNMGGKAFIGTTGLEKTDEIREELIDFAGENEMYIPGTFSGKK